MFQWYYLALISSILFGFSTLVEKKSLKKEHAMAFTSSFAIVAAIISLLFIPLADFSISLVSAVLIYLISVVVALTYLLIARVYKHSNISAASPIYTALPSLFVVLFAFVFLGEELSPVRYLFIGVLVAATYMIMFTGKKQFESKKYVHWLIIASLLSTISAIGVKYLLSSVTPFTYLILLEVFVALNMVVAMQVKYGGVREIVSNTFAYKKEIAAIALLITAYRITYYLSASVAQISLVWPLSNVPNVIMVVFFSSLLFKEDSTKRKLVLAIIMLVAAYFIVV
jgi:drug/metabolite transporter (DMT)-like permease